MALRQGGAVAAEVVFRELAGAQAVQQAFSPFAAPGGQRAEEQRLEPRGAGGVVVDAKVIGDQRKGRYQVGPKPARPQKAVLDPQAGGGKGVRLLAGPDQQRAVQPCGRGGGSGRVVLEDQGLMRAEEGLKPAALPGPHPGGDMAAAILPEGAGLGLQLVERVFEAAQLVAGRIVPHRRQYHRRGEKLVAGQQAAAAARGTRSCVRPQPA
ncbi:hypothetical protein MASR1M32_18350 [Rhodobacter sp.]